MLEFSSTDHGPPHDAHLITISLTGRIDDSPLLDCPGHGFVGIDHQRSCVLFTELLRLVQRRKNVTRQLLCRVHFLGRLLANDNFLFRHLSIVRTCILDIRRHVSRPVQPHIQILFAPLESADRSMGRDEPR